MLDWVSALPDRRVPGVPSVPPQFSADFCGTRAEDAGVPCVPALATGTRGTQKSASGVPAKSLKSLQEHAEHAEHASKGKGVLGLWRKGLSSLDFGLPPDGVALGRWEELVRDAIGLFNDWGWQAAGLGWDERDLFGVNPAGLRGSLGHMGLAWRLDGRSVVAMADHAASILRRTEGVQRYYRGDPSGLVPLWELGGSGAGR